MLQLKEDRPFAVENNMRIPSEISNKHTVDNNCLSNQRIEAMIRQFKDAFQGTDRTRDIKMTENRTEFRIKQGAAPLAQRPRPVPDYLLKPLCQCGQCVSDDIFEIRFRQTSHISGPVSPIPHSRGTFI